MDIERIRLPLRARFEAGSSTTSGKLLFGSYPVADVRLECRKKGRIIYLVSDPQLPPAAQLGDMSLRGEAIVAEFCLSVEEAQELGPGKRVPFHWDEKVHVHLSGRRIAVAEFAIRDSQVVLVIKEVEAIHTIKSENPAAMSVRSDLRARILLGELFVTTKDLLGLDSGTILTLASPTKPFLLLEDGRTFPCDVMQADGSHFARIHSPAYTKELAKAATMHHANPPQGKVTGDSQSTELAKNTWVAIDEMEMQDFMDLFFQCNHSTAALLLSGASDQRAALAAHSLTNEYAARLLLSIASNSIPHKQYVQAIRKNLAIDFEPVSGIERVADILKEIEPVDRTDLYDTMEDENNELAQKIRSCIFEFEDIMHLDDRALQLLFTQTEKQDWAKALKSVGTEIHEKVFRCLAAREASLLREDIEFLGAIRLKDVNDAQKRIVNKASQLEAKGEIISARTTGEDDFVV